MLDMEQKDEALDQEEDDDDGLEAEEVEEYDYPAVLITEEVRRCNPNNGRGWICQKMAEPRFAMCLQHTSSLAVKPTRDSSTRSCKVALVGYRSHDRRHYDVSDRRP